MTRSRITLAVLAAATILIAAAPAEARKAKRHPVTAPSIDVAAIPPYPMSGESAPAGARRIGHAGKRLRRAAHSPGARNAYQRPSYGSGIVRSGKTGATAHVSPRYAPEFQAYVDDLEANGATVRFMGGYRKGRCWSGGMHPCGKALDVCQLARGVVDRRCNLPNKGRMIEIARRHGLFEGGQWCSQDRGHAQVGVSAGACGSNLYAAVRKFKHRRMALRSDHRL